VLTTLPSQKVSRIEELLPHNWQQAQESVMDGRSP